MRPCPAAPPPSVPSFSSPAFPQLFYSARFWDAEEKMFKDEQGRYYKNDWHRIECYFKMNSIQNGKGVPDGVIQYSTGTTESWS